MGRKTKRKRWKISIFFLFQPIRPGLIEERRTSKVKANLILTGGFLGSGKTTLLKKTAELLQGEKKPIQQKKWLDAVP